MKRLINISFVFAVVSTCLVLVYGCGEVKGPMVITKSIIYPDPLLEHDFTARAYDVPLRYNPEGVVNPFMTLADHRAAAVRTAKIAKTDVIDVPITTLTSAALRDLNLTSVVVNHTFAYAFFTVGSSEKCYKATIGDYVGKNGITITSITPGVVHLSDGNTLAKR